MNEFLTDYLTENKVFISTARAERPHHYKREDSLFHDTKSTCPFCFENKHLTPMDILSVGHGEIRIVPNKYPAVSLPFGYHDVVIDTKNHEKRFIEFSTLHIEMILKAIQIRISDLYEKENIEYIQVFKNDGINSGASIAHSHWQITALNYIPAKQKTIQRNFNKFYDNENKDYMAYIYTLKELLVYENESAFAYCPSAPLYSNTVHIALKNNNAMFQGFDAKSISDIAEVLHKTLNGLKSILGEFSYNIVFNLFPKGEYRHSSFFIEIIPRIGKFAGFELSTGCYINHVHPMAAAEKLRGIIK